jgi:hypothetical protein
MLGAGRVDENSVTALIAYYERRGGGLDTICEVVIFAPGGSLAPELYRYSDNRIKRDSTGMPSTISSYLVIASRQHQLPLNYIDPLSVVSEPIEASQNIRINARKSSRGGSCIWGKRVD